MVVDAGYELVGGFDSHATKAMKISRVWVGD